jgi:dimethylaniline monooxygenase (N-oxide forming)
MAIKQKRVAIIGGGVSGLAAAKAFKAHGHVVVGFERSEDLGGVWELSKSYPGLETQSPKDLYRYTDHPMPDHYPEWPTGPQVHAYLRSYAAKHAIDPLFRTGVEVTEMSPREDGLPGWRLALVSQSGSEVQDFDFVAVCTGHFSTPNRVIHRRQSEFEHAGGQVLHSSDYTDACQAAGKRVVILGAGKSATDLAVNAVENGAKAVTMVYRRPIWRVPRFLMGVGFKKLGYMRLQEMQFNGWGRTRRQRLLAKLMRPLIWANFRALEAVIKAQLGLKKVDMLPDQPIDKAISCDIPIVTPGFFEGLRDGRIQAIRAEIDHYEPGRVVLSTGQRLDCELAVMATGWSFGLPFLPTFAREHLVEEDGLHRLYRLAVNPTLPNMGFVGLNASFCSVLSAELIAHWLVRYADGQLENQPAPEHMNADIDRMLEWRRNERPSAQVYGGLCAAPFHFKHYDELLADMGAAERRHPNIVSHYFGYPQAEVFGRFLKSAPHYKVGERGDQAS